MKTVPNNCFVVLAALGFAVSSSALAHKPQAETEPAPPTHAACDMRAMDHSTMTAAEHDQHMADCERAKAAVKNKSCDMSDMDLSTMSAAEHEKRMAGCATAPAPAPATQPQGGS